MIKKEKTNASWILRTCPFIRSSAHDFGKHCFIRFSMKLSAFLMRLVNATPIFPRTTPVNGIPRIASTMQRTLPHVVFGVIFP